MANVTGTFSGTGQSGTFVTQGGATTKKSHPSRFNVSMNFVGTASVTLERSFDGGTTWFTVAVYTGSASIMREEIEQSVGYRLNCTAHTDNVVYRLSS